MNITLENLKVSGEITAPPSKSYAHRLLICAALSDGPCEIICRDTNDDIDRTADCLRALGAIITRTEAGFAVTPVDRANLPHKVQMDVGESGSTLRFMLPICAVLGVTAEIKMHGRLPSRPLAPLDGELYRHGAVIEETAEDAVKISGKIGSGIYQIDGGVSSQFVTGLLLALIHAEGESEIEIIGKTESKPYIDMTLATMREFGAVIHEAENTYKVHPTPLLSQKSAQVEGDWSGAAFLLVAGAFSEEGITVRGLNPHSAQGDRAILDVLRQFGASVRVDEDSVTVRRGKLEGIVLDGRDIPDLIPIIATLASVSEGTTVIENCARLRLKESDRMVTTRDGLNSLGAKVYIDGDSLIIRGVPSLKGGTSDSFGDHRIAMSLSVASCMAEEPVTVLRAECVSKSYPKFYEDFTKARGERP